MRDSLSFLLYNRALVEIGRHIMRRCTDEFDAAVIGLVIGLSTFETRQEGMVDIDDFSSHFDGEIIRQNLHIAGEDDEIGFGAGNELRQLFLLCVFVVFGHRQDIIRNALVFGSAARIFMVGDDGNNVGVQPADANLVKQMQHGMVEF